MTTAEQDIKIERIDQKVDSFKETVENFIQEMRDRDNKRDADIKELRMQREEDRKKHDADMKEIAKQREEDRVKHEADMKAMQEKQDAIANELRTEIHAATRDIRTFTIASVVGIGAIVVGVLGFIANSIVNPPQPQIYFYPPPVQMQQSNIEEDKTH